MMVVTSPAGEHRAEAGAWIAKEKLRDVLPRTVSRWEDEVVAAVLTGVANARSAA